jgi:hypothetical protein
MIEMSGLALMSVLSSTSQGSRRTEWSAKKSGSAKPWLPSKSSRLVSPASWLAGYFELKWPGMIPWDAKLGGLTDWQYRLDRAMPKTGRWDGRTMKAYYG